MCKQQKQKKKVRNKKKNFFHLYGLPRKIEKQWLYKWCVSLQEVIHTLIFQVLKMPTKSSAQPHDDQSQQTIYRARHGQLTVGELLRILENVVRKNPEARDIPVFHVEFGGLVPSTVVEVEEDKLVISAGH